MRRLRGFPLALAALGLAARVAPLFDLQGRNLRQFPSEDGYLMLTIARNIELGHGMSIADGTIATNGTQPLMAYIYALAFWLVGGDKAWGVLLVQVFQIAIALAAALVLYRVGRRILAGEPEADAIAALAAGLWFAGPLAVKHTQNCLETGGYALAILFVAACVLRLPAGERPWPVRTCMGLGAVLAAAFWVRNDASLLAAAVCAGRVLPALPRGVAVLRERVLEATVVGAIALAGAAPWLVHNLMRFGYLMPISGVAEGSGFVRGQNLVDLPAALAEYVLIALPIPSQWEERPLAIAVSTLVVIAGIAAAALLAVRLQAPARRWFGILGLWSALLAVFYGFFFGVGFFVSRYFFPLSPFLALVSVYWAYRAWSAAIPRFAPVRLAAPTLLVLLVLGLDARLYLRGTNQGHFQVVEWVQRNVPDDVWVGAVQTGTLGFFHDRTINLDGKVNPDALKARLEHRTQDYVLESPIQYLADWVGIETWLHGTALEGRFVSLVFDPERNLVVLRRAPP
jgi:hypothetical protein